MSRTAVFFDRCDTPVYKSPAYERTHKTLARPFVAHLTLGAVRYFISIAEGYRFNGANLPRLLWPIFGHPYQAPRDMAALIHDALYDNKFFTRAAADRLYREICASLGYDFIRRWTEWFFIRLFGGRFWRRSRASNLIHLGDNANYIFENSFINPFK